MSFKTISTFGTITNIGTISKIRNHYEHRNNFENSKPFRTSEFFYEWRAILFSYLYELQVINQLSGNYLFSWVDRGYLKLKRPGVGSGPFHSDCKSSRTRDFHWNFACWLLISREVKFWTTHFTLCESRKIGRKLSEIFNGLLHQ